MADICPLCKRDDQTKSLSGHWNDLTPGSVHYARLKQPSEAEVRYLYALGVALLGVALLMTGAVLPGVVVLAGGIGWGVVMSRQVAVADGKRAVWARSKWCGRCTEAFDPKA